MIALSRFSRHLPPAQFLIMNLALGIGHCLVLLNAGAFLPMLPYVTGTMDEGLPYVVWAQSDYFTALGCAFLIARPLMRRYGPKRVSLAAYLLFSLASLGCLLSAHQLTGFIGFRILQGFAAGLSVVPSFFLLLEYYHLEKQPFATALWGLSVFIPFSVGPALGGWFAYVLGDWRLLFFASFLISFLVAAILWALLADWEDVTSPDTGILWPFLLFVAFSCCALLTQKFFDIGLLSDLSSRYHQLWIVGFILLPVLLGFAYGNRRSPVPLIDTSLFLQRNFSFGLLIFCLSFMLIQSAAVQYIIRLQLVDGYPAWQVGLLFVPLFIFSKPLSLATQHQIQKHKDPRLIATLSLLTLALSFWWISSYLRPATWEFLLLPQFLLGAALGPFFSSMTTLTLGHIRQEQQLPALDLLNGIRNLSAGLAITFSDIGWDRLQDHEWHRLNTPDVSNALRFLSDSVIPAKRIQTEMEWVSGLLTFNDFFQILALGTLPFVILVWFLHRPPLTRKNASDLAILENLGEEP